MTRYLLVLLAGCATQQASYYWHREGATQVERQMDAGQCEAQGLSATRDPERLTHIYLSCMKGKGWQLLER